MLPNHSALQQRRVFLRSPKRFPEVVLPFVQSKTEINMPPTKQFMVAGHEFLCYNCKGLHPSSCTISDVMAVWVKESCRQRVALIVVHVTWNPALRQMVRHGWLCYKKPIALCSFKRKSINKPALQSQSTRLHMEHFLSRFRSWLESRAHHLSKLIPYTRIQLRLLKMPLAR